MGPRSCNGGIPITPVSASAAAELTSGRMNTRIPAASQGRLRFRLLSSPNQHVQSIRPSPPSRRAGTCEKPPTRASVPGRVAILAAQGRFRRHGIAARRSGRRSLEPDFPQIRPDASRILRARPGTVNTTMSAIAPPQKCQPVGTSSGAEQRTSPPSWRLAASRDPMTTLSHRARPERPSRALRSRR